MLTRLPRSLPTVDQLLADLGHPAPRDLAPALGVSERTVWRWHATGWPRCAHLALYFASSWGWSAVECDAHNTLATHQALAKAYLAERDAARAQLAHVLHLARFGAANSPLANAPPAPSTSLRA
jgi:hypothetical protein